tara:strand:- start:1328 stop:2092 length:765 start_codon:yes stop_codon:yes gene_type:complete
MRLKKRLIAVLLLRDGKVVQSVKFEHTNVIHYNPIHAVESFNHWSLDELIVLNVSKSETSKKQFIDIVKNITRKVFVPVTAGGYINSEDDVYDLLLSGADKVIINTLLFKNKTILKKIIEKFGSQCIVGSVDSKRVNKYNYAFIERGSVNTGINTIQWCKQIEELGVGEIFINSIDHDGFRKGYNIELFKEVNNKIKVPLIIMGGVLIWEHLIQAYKKIGASGYAAANIFHYTEHSIRKAKKELLKKNLNFRRL